MRHAPTALLLTMSLVISILAPGSLGAPASAAGEQPDIYMVMVDDLAYIQNERILKRLPNIRKNFLRKGRRLTQIYNEVPVCCPARANFLSGQHTYRNGVVRNEGDPLDQTKTIAVALDAVGYHTFLVGKFLIGYDGDRQPPGWDRISFTGGFNPTFWRQGVLTKYDKFVDEAVRRQVVAWTRHAPTDSPLFAVVTPRAPHAFLRQHQKARGYVPQVIKADKGARRCRGISHYRPPTYSLISVRAPRNEPMPGWPNGWKLRKTCESLLLIDRMVGQLVQAQKDRGRPAYFFFMSDNGMSWGRDGNPWKRVPNSTRLPFYVRGPGIEQGSESEALLSMIDVPVTIADMAGARMPWADGMSFLPVLLGGGSGGNGEILEMAHERPKGTPNYNGWESIRTPRWHYVRWDDGTRQLFEYSLDPWERFDLIDSMPGVANGLEERLDALIERSRG